MCHPKDFFFFLLYQSFIEQAEVDWCSFAWQPDVVLSSLVNSYVFMGLAWCTAVLEQERFFPRLFFHKVGSLQLSKMSFCMLQLYQKGMSTNFWPYCVYLQPHCMCSCEMMTQFIHSPSLQTYLTCSFIPWNLEPFFLLAHMLRFAVYCAHG